MEPPAKQRRMTQTKSLQGDVDELIADLSNAARHPDNHGTFTPAIYDSAWVAMVIDPNSGGKRLLFPQCFEYILETQLDDGSWSEYASEVDGILNTSAALLALLKHPSGQAGITDRSIESRIQRAKTALSRKLQAWDVSSCDHVGFEVLVPQLLVYLTKHGVHTDFPSRVQLLEKHRQKMKVFRPEYTYSHHKSTMLHSLEGLIGLIDFNKVRHHVDRSTGIMGSPSSTAAYLSQTSTWNQDAEHYLRRVVSKRSDGGVPSAFPTTTFEISWAISLLFKHGIGCVESSHPSIPAVTGYLRKQIGSEGTTGFAPGIQPDVDDTAKTLSALQSTGVQASVEGMTAKFEVGDHFKTYSRETNPSFTANCNVLAALIDQKDPSSSLSSIGKVIRFLIEAWNQGPIQDKWNLASEYSYLSFAVPLIDVLIQHDRHDTFKDMQQFDQLLKEIPIVLIQLLSRLLVSQQQSGSWRSSVETTAYVTITLAYMLKLPWPPVITDSIKGSLTRSRSFLAAHDSLWAGAQRMWVEKVTYGSSLLSRSYCLAAMQAPAEQFHWQGAIKEIFQEVSGTTGIVHLFRTLPLHCETDPGLLQLAILEASFYLRQLQQLRSSVFAERDLVMTPDKWMQFIPIAWTSSMLKLSTALPPRVMWEMMIISMLNYQVDEYIESVVATLSDHALEIMDSIVQDQCRFSRTGCSVAVSPTASSRSWTQHAHCSLKQAAAWKSSASYPGSEIANVETTLGKFIKYVLNHTLVVQAPERVRASLARELCGYLRAQLSHTRSNARLRAGSLTTNGNNIRQNNVQPARGLHDEESTYLEWARTVGADDTSCPYSFVFFSCLVGSYTNYPFDNFQLEYVTSSLFKSLATMCRQYNDYGSVARDQAESNLNSLHFPEFETTLDSEMAVEAAKTKLLYVAEFERQLMEVAMAKVQDLVQDQRIISALRAFVLVTDVFGQIYVARDIASRVKRTLE